MPLDNDSQTVNSGQSGIGSNSHRSNAAEATKTLAMTAAELKRERLNRFALLRQKLEDSQLPTRKPYTYLAQVVLTPPPELVEEVINPVMPEADMATGSENNSTPEAIEEVIELSMPDNYRTTEPDNTATTEATEKVIELSMPELQMVTEPDIITTTEVVEDEFDRLEKELDHLVLEPQMGTDFNIISSSEVVEDEFDLMMSESQLAAEFDSIFGPDKGKDELDPMIADAHDKLSSYLATSPLEKMSSLLAEIDSVSSLVKKVKSELAQINELYENYSHLAENNESINEQFTQLQVYDGLAQEMILTINAISEAKWRDPSKKEIRQHLEAFITTKDKSPANLLENLIELKDKIEANIISQSLTNATRIHSQLFAPRKPSLTPYDTGKRLPAPMILTKKGTLPDTLIVPPRKDLAEAVSYNPFILLYHGIVRMLQLLTSSHFHANQSRVNDMISYEKSSLENHLSKTLKGKPVFIGPVSDELIKGARQTNQSLQKYTFKDNARINSLKGNHLSLDALANIYQIDYKFRKLRQHGNEALKTGVEESYGKFCQFILENLDKLSSIDPSELLEYEAFVDKTDIYSVIEIFNRFNDEGSFNDYLTKQLQVITEDKPANEVIVELEAHRTLLYNIIQLAASENLLPSKRISRLVEENKQIDKYLKVLIQTSNNQIEEQSDVKFDLEQIFEGSTLTLIKLNVLEAYMATMTFTFKNGNTSAYMNSMQALLEKAINALNSIGESTVDADDIKEKLDGFKHIVCAPDNSLSEKISEVDNFNQINGRSNSF